MSMLTKPHIRAKHLARQTGHWLKENLKEHLSDSTAMAVLSAPIFAASETIFSGMENSVSINTRLTIAGLTYLGGLGLLYGKGRTLSRKLFNITEKTKEGYQHLHDLPYTGMFNLVTAPAIYYFMGARDFDQIAIGSLIATGIGVTGGSIMGWAIDAYGDLTGVKESNRWGYPQFVKKQHSYVKKTIAAGLVAASLGLTCGVYQFNNYLGRDVQQSAEQIAPQVEQVQPSVQKNLEQTVNEGEIK